MEINGSSSFCRGCTGRAEIKVMCPMFNTNASGYTCVALFHCKRCVYYVGVNIEECKVDCSYPSMQSRKKDE